MGVTFEWDEKAFKKQLEDVVEGGLKEIGADLQSAIDDVEKSHSKKPVEAVAVALRSALAAHNTGLPEEHLAAYAEAISNGRHVVFSVERPNLDI
jgi:hypothetical protein